MKQHKKIKAPAIVELDLGVLLFKGCRCRVVATLHSEELISALRFRNPGYRKVERLQKGRPVKIIRETAGMVILVTPVDK